MITTRLAMPYDKEAVLDLVEMDVAETLPHLDFRRDLAAETFDQSVNHADPTTFVAEEDGEIIGFLVGLLEGYAFTSGIFVVQEVLYVRPDKRGTRAAAALLKEFLAWGETVGARECIFGISNGMHPERTAKFMQHVTGAEPVGIYLKKVM